MQRREEHASENGTCGNVSVRPSIAIIIAFVVVGVLGLGLAAMHALRDPVGIRPAEGFEALRAAATYKTSDNCAVCHYDRHASWARTFHRTMTQEANEQTVVGAFDGKPFTMLGVRNAARREGDRFILETSHPLTGETTPFEIVRTVGSRRMQQYLTKIGDRHIRLPVAWSIVEQRWFHLSEAFFHDDGGSYHANTAVWDVNCIFCHNVDPKPGWDLQRPPPAAVPAMGVDLIDGSVDSHVAELGIACEACHGPGETHAALMRSPLRRYAFHFTGADDPTIVHPGKLEQERSVQVCARCHGQRIPAAPDRIGEIMLHGDPFTPGENLAAYYQPLQHGMTLGDYDFSPRFWSDGSPRLTAYEYQGLLRSRCYTDGAMTCLSCHAMHAGDPRGQLRPDLPGDEMCLQCHGVYRGDAALERHTYHKPDSTGSRCVACHMPEVVYGIMSWHPTHEIGSPDPAHSARYNKPDACTLCHSGQSLRWAAEKSKAWWPDAVADPAGLDARFDLAELPRALFAGDVVYRALAAHRLGQPSPDAGVDALAPPLLGVTLLDPFPSVRRMARNALADRLPQRSWPFALDDEAQRRRARDALLAQPIRETLPPALAPFSAADGRLRMDLLEELIDGREEVPFSFGE